MSVTQGGRAFGVRRRARSPADVVRLKSSPGEPQYDAPGACSAWALSCCSRACPWLVAASALAFATLPKHLAATSFPPRPAPASGASRRPGAAPAARAAAGPLRERRSHARTESAAVSPHDRPGARSGGCGSRSTLAARDPAGTTRGASHPRSPGRSGGDDATISALAADARSECAQRTGPAAARRDPAAAGTARAPLRRDRTSSTGARRTACRRSAGIGARRASRCCAPTSLCQRTRSAAADRGSPAGRGDRAELLLGERAAGAAARPELIARRAGPALQASSAAGARDMTLAAQTLGEVTSVAPRS